ncbi:ABC transporter permease [Falsiroseomonas oryzae]|uniref:ABC transporter permease n=1 Tax=Falsiroseomonas oryzae TaxID=2766473 RepID=UPI0022EA654D|nr:ABC transporter permease [Roseomonas sp. MO-31]
MSAASDSRTPAEAVAPPPPAAWKRALAKARSNPTTMVGALICLAILLGAVLAPWIAPHDPAEQNILDRLLPPGGDYPLGTDQFGRDILSRLLWGARISLSVSLSAIAIAMVIGGAIGMVSGYIGGRFDLITMQVMDVLLSFPSLILGLIVVALLGPDLVNLIVAIALTAIAPFARIARAPTLALKERAFVEAGRALGFSHTRILFRHILPNITSEVMVMATLWLATAVRVEASLSFIGLGVKPPTPTWGGMTRDGFENILDSAWLATLPGLAILLLVLGLNMVGDGLRDATDPKLRNE